MRILFLLTQDIESPSGLGRYFPMAKVLADLGHSVTIAALHSNFEALQQKKFQRDGVTVHYVAPMHVRKTGNLKTYYSPLRLAIVVMKAAYHLARAALRTPSDIILVGKPQPMNSIAGLVGRLFRRARLVLDCDDFEAGSGHFQNRLQHSIVAFFEYNVPRLADIVTTNTIFMQEKLKSWGVSGAKIHYLPNGYDEKRFQKPVDGVVEQKAVELKISDRKVVAFIGSLSLGSHPVDLLVRAAARVRKAVPSAMLLIVGGGEDLETLKTLAAELGLMEAVCFCGRVPSDAVPIYYRLARVTVDPVYDNDAARGRCPLKLFESWACEVPFVTSDVGDRRHLLGDPAAGLLVDPGNPDSLADAIITILQQPELAKMLAERGNARVWAYTWNLLGQDLNRVLSES